MTCQGSPNTIYNFIKNINFYSLTTVSMCDFNLKLKLENNGIGEPFVIRKCVPTMKWTFASLNPKKLSQMLGNKKLKFRVGKITKSKSELNWEHESEFIFASMEEFIQWSESNKPLHTGPFKQFTRSKNWCYADYMYVKDLFESHPYFNLAESIDWSTLGFSKNEGQDSAVWIGSPGANTVCHYDTYGYNLVYQVYGSKRWIMFPPSNTNYLYPTRLPYEESSIFSKVNVLVPDFKQHERFTKSNPYIVILEAGDLLYVPHHWWHSVENLELSISVNAWFPVDQDHQNRLHEAITQLLISVTSEQDPHLDRLLISKADLPTFEQSLKTLHQTFSECSKNKASHTDRKVSPRVELGNKCCCALSEPIFSLGSERFLSLDRFCVGHACEKLERWKPLKGDLVLGDEPPCKKSCDSTIVEKLDFQQFVECLTRPKVIQCIADELKHNDYT